jgi:succinoglycan biosynthesis protein ExoM
MRTRTDCCRTSILIAVCTSDRPREVERLISALHRVAAPDSVVRVAIFDNGREPLERLPDSVGVWPLERVRVPDAGLSNVRNAALDFRTPGEHLVFIDDDEVPSPEWLSALEQGSRLHPSSIIAGPVLRVDPSGSMIPWPGKARREGLALETAGFGNVLIPSSFLDASTLRFDQRLNLSGGEDTCFSIRARKEGIAIRWSCSAICTEIRPPARDGASQRLRRTYVQAAVYSYVMRRHPPAFLRRLGVGMACLLAGPIALLGGVRPSVSTAEAADILATGAGAMVGLCCRRPPKR